MTREEARKRIYDVINSGIIDTELEQDLTEIVNCICEGAFELCEGDRYCEGCEYQKDNED